MLDGYVRPPQPPWVRADAIRNHLFLGTHGPCQAPFLSCHAFSRFIPSPQRWRTVVIAGAATANSCGAIGAACTGAARPIRPARAIVGMINARTNVLLIA